MNGRVRLADFGLLINLSDLATSGLPRRAKSYRWMSPELLDPEGHGLKDSRPTKSSDCYALGMVIYEVLSGQVPFARYHQYVAAGKAVLGQHPEKPQGEEGVWFTDEIWSILEGCWQRKPAERLDVQDVFIRWGRLKEVSGSWTSPLPLVVKGPRSTYLPRWSFYERKSRRMAPH